MQSTKTASITDTISVSADEVRALVCVAAKNFAGIVDDRNGVKLVSSDVTLAGDGSATVAIVYEQSDAPAAQSPEQPTADQGAAQEGQEASPPAPPAAPVLNLALTPPAA